MQQLWELMVPAVLLWMCPLELQEQRIRGEHLVLLVLAEICRAVSAPILPGYEFAILILSLLPGGLLLIAGMIFDGQLGEGDGLLFLALGCGLRPMDTLLLCQTALILAALWGLIRGRKGSLPLVPFVAAVSGAQTLAGMGGAG